MKATSAMRKHECIDELLSYQALFTKSETVPELRLRVKAERVKRGLERSKEKSLAELTKPELLTMAVEYGLTGLDPSKSHATILAAVREAQSLNTPATTQAFWNSE